MFSLFQFPSRRPTPLMLSLFQFPCSRLPLPTPSLFPSCRPPLPTHTIGRPCQHQACFRATGCTCQHPARSSVVYHPRQHLDRSAAFTDILPDLEQSAIFADTLPDLHQSAVSADPLPLGRPSKWLCRTLSPQGPEHLSTSRAAPPTSSTSRVTLQTLSTSRVAPPICPTVWSTSRAAPLICPAIWSTSRVAPPICPAFIFSRAVPPVCPGYQLNLLSDSTCLSCLPVMFSSGPSDDPCCAPVLSLGCPPELPCPAHLRFHSRPALRAPACLSPWIPATSPSLRFPASNPSPKFPPRLCLHLSSPALPHVTELVWFSNKQESEVLCFLIITAVLWLFLVSGGCKVLKLDRSGSSCFVYVVHLFCFCGSRTSQNIPKLQEGKASGCD
ncbi:proline-rich protein 36-like [Thunnus maccoyii]|uniref:proline-rich protein 36-like n=1 Tax=Thunnus maccoyii TaxID=8240 RepID=UPI001C4CE3D0|nr:proline-rich protein 36-like [Thunnus maccoyii]